MIKMKKIKYFRMKKLKVFSVSTIDKVFIACWMKKIDTGDYAEFQRKTRLSYETYYSKCTI